MDELAVRCKQQLETFRIKELKDVLSRVGAAKQGKKQVLLEKIMAIILSSERLEWGLKGFKPESFSNRHFLSREEVAKVIDDIYRKMRGSSASDLATVGGNMPVASNSMGRLDEHAKVLKRRGAETRCPCGSSKGLGNMIQCQDPDCMVWQHINCVIIPEKEGMEPEFPSPFYCEICRSKLGDPFCVAVEHVLLPTRMITSIVASEGSSALQNVEKSFILSGSHQEMLRRPNYDLQIWSVMLNDKVTFRIHWPLYADLRVNGVPVRVTNRPGQQSLGINGRDDGPGIANYTREGTNNISLSASDGRPFCIGIRIIRRLTVPEVLSFIPSEAKGEPFDTALARVRRCIGGGVGNDDDSDSDLEVVSEWVPVNLCCPISGSRMKVAGRFSGCVHMGCFDLHTFVELNQRARKWQCPICLKNYLLGNLIIDPFFNRITKAMKSYGEDITEVEMKPDGCWRPKLEGDVKLLEPWRSPDGSISLVNSDNRPMSYQGTLKAVKIEEGLSIEKVPLKIGFKRARDGTWQVNGTIGFPFLASNGMPTHNQIPENRLIYQSSSATASNDEDPSVNQDQSELLNQSRRDDGEVNSASKEPPANTLLNGPIAGDSEPPKTSELIILSDTEEENTDGYSLGTENCNKTTNLRSPVPLAEETPVASGSRQEFIHERPETAVPFPEVNTARENTNEALDFFGSNTGDLAVPLLHNNFWTSQAQSAPFEFLGSVPDASMEAQTHHHSEYQTSSQAVPRPTYGLSRQHHRENGMLQAGFFEYNRPPQSFVVPEYHSEVMESARGLASADPSLQLFLPHQPARASAQPVVHEPLMSSNEGLQDGWFSLSLGGGESMTESPAYAVDPPYDVEQPSQERRQLDSVVDSASVVLDISTHGKQAVSGDSMAPVQRRMSGIALHRSSPLPRNYFRVDSDSE